MPVLLENISYTYMPGTPYARQALKEVSLTVEKGEFVALVGHSGSGKSTLAQHISGLLHPMSGRVLVNGQDLAEKNGQAKAARSQVGIVFQYPEHQLFAETVFEDIAFGPRNMGLDEEEVKRRVAWALNFVRLSAEEFSERSPFKLSGGQMRRVAIAGVIAMQPDYLLLDEPSAGLDPLSRNILYEEMLALHKSTGAAIIMVTHSMDEAIRLAGRLLVMSDGRVVLDGSPKEIFSSKQDELIQAGVDVPEIVTLAEHLRSRGLALSESCLDGISLTKEICQILRQRGKLQC